MENESQTKPSEGKQIQEIWTDAFITAKPVLLCGKKANNQFTEAWFKCVDERMYPLTKAELLDYMPDAQIHKDYRYDASRKNNTGTTIAELGAGC